MDFSKFNKVTWIGAIGGAIMASMITGKIGAIQGAVGGGAGALLTGIVFMRIDGVQTKRTLAQYGKAAEAWKNQAPGQSDCHTAVGSLIEKILADSHGVGLGAYKYFRYFTDGRFVEFADSLPPVVDKAFSAVKHMTITPEAIEQGIPSDVLNKGHPIQGAKKQNGHYLLSDANYSAYVDSIYYEYLLYRYPGATVLALYEQSPVVWVQDGILRAILMPIDSNVKQDQYEEKHTDA